MKSRLYWLLVLVLAMGMLLSACGGEEATEGAVEEPVAETVVEPTEEPEPEPAAEEAVAEEAVVEEEKPAEEAEVVEEVVPAGEQDLDEAYGAMLASMVKYNTTGLDTLNEQLASDPPPFMLDVRQPEELEEKGHIEGAVNIPLRELGQHTELLPSFETPIVSYCGSGWRCTIAMTDLAALGWDSTRLSQIRAYWPLSTNLWKQFPRAGVASRPNSSIPSWPRILT
jgi:rhodanese-related sulfurtransferase